MCYKNDFQKIDTPEKAYVLGLYYSDGFISKNLKTGCYFSSITLNKGDVELLLNIKEVFPFFKLSNTKRSVNELRLNQKMAVLDLESNGVLTRKSTENRNKLRFPKINSSLYSHFIRGMFDGDGSICFSSKNSVNSKNFNIVGANYFLLKKIREVLYFEGIDLRWSSRRGSPLQVDGKTANFKQLCFYIYRYGNRKVLERLSKYLYKDATLFMQRKREIFEKWEDVIKPTLECPRCGELTSNIERKRIFCKACKHYSKYNRVYYRVENHFCKHCNSKNVVFNGLSKSRRSKKVTGGTLLCRDCNRNTTRKIINRSFCAPLHSNV